MGALVRELATHPDNLNVMPGSGEKRAPAPTSSLLTTTHIQEFIPIPLTQNK